MKRKLLTITAMVITLATLAACRVNIPGPVGDGKRHVEVEVRDAATDRTIAGSATITTTAPNGTITTTTMPFIGTAGAADRIPDCPSTFTVSVTAPGYREKVEGPFGVETASCGNFDKARGEVIIARLEKLPPPAPVHADPSKAPIDILGRPMGALFTARGPCPGGPRPGQPDNICSTAVREPGGLPTVLAVYRKNAYTHGPIGPWIDPGYHGQEPAQDFRLDNGKSAIANLQLMWDGGVIPICFLGPDNFTLDQMRAIEHIFRQEGFQRLCRIVVPKGWEPSIDTPNAEWVRWFEWARGVFPNALYAIHMAADFDAPGNNTDLSPECHQIPEHERVGACRDNPNQANPAYLGNDGVWRRLAPYLHIYLQQLGPYYDGPAGRPDIAVEFRKIYQTPNRFESGLNGWPTSSAWGPGRPVCQTFAEATSYSAWWHNRPEAEARAWGDLALAMGACGSLESFTPGAGDFERQARLFRAIGVVIK